MWLYRFRFLRIAQYFQHVIIRNKVKSWENVTFCFQILLQSTLNQLKSVVHFIQLLQELRRIKAVSGMHCGLLNVHVVSYVSPIGSQTVKIVSLLRQLLSYIFTEKNILKNAAKLILERCAFF